MRDIIYYPGNIDLYSLTNEHLNQFCIGVAVKAGCLYESKDNNGYAHMYEHMVFKNLKNAYGNSFYSLLAKNGIDVTAATYKEFILFRISGVKSGFSFACDILSHLFDDIAISAFDLELEKKRIKAEIKEKEERSWLSYKCEKEVWKDTNLSQTIHGYCKNIDNASIKSINSYKRSIISRGNVFAVITGNADDACINHLKNTLNRIPLSECAEKNNIAQLPNCFLNRQKNIITKDGWYTRVYISVDYEANKENRQLIDLLYYILFVGYDSLVNQFLSEKTSILYSYECNDDRYSNIGCISIEYEVTENRLEESLLQLMECFNAAKKGEFDFEANIQKAITEYAVSYDSAYDKCFEIVNALIVNGGNCNELNKEFELIKSIKKDDVISCARNVLTEKNIVLGIEGNIREIKKKTESLIGIIENI